MGTPDETLKRIDEASLVGGAEQRDATLVDCDEAWVARFEHEQAKIRCALPLSAGLVEHIGSTAVQDLPAKPIIDILLTVANVEDEASYLPALEGAGYFVRVREPGHRMLRTPDLAVHVHVLSYDDSAAIGTWPSGTGCAQTQTICSFT